MSPPPPTPAGFERFIAWVQAERRAGRFFCYGIVPEGRDHAVGLLQVRRLEPGFGTAEWGFALGRPFWGTGLFTTSAEMVVDFALRHVGVHRLEARAVTVNHRGNGALRKLAAECEGVLRRSLHDSTETDQLMWSIIDEDWFQAHPLPAHATRWPDVPEVKTAEPAALPAPDIAHDAPTWRRVPPTLEGRACRLREIVPADAAALVSTLSDERVRHYIAPPPSTVASFEQFILWAHRQRQSGRFLCIVVVPNGADEPVGLFQLRALDPMFRTAEWGFALGAAHWGSGLFVDAAGTLLDWAFDALGICRLEARAAMANKRATGALRKLRHVREGWLRRSFLMGNEYVDDALWALLADEWRASRASRLVAGG
jgi:RimJ/RimL family protein N-acetyltransferase